MKLASEPLRFARFELRPDERRLLMDGEPVSLWGEMDLDDADMLLGFDFISGHHIYVANSQGLLHITPDIVNLASSRECKE